ncbi:hypothetical protein D3C87_1254880 [compost metagenome]
MRGYREASRGIFLHVQLHFVAGHAAFFLGVNAVVAFDRLDVAAFITHACANQFVRIVDGFCQLERPVVWQAFIGRVDGNLDAVFRVLAIGGERPGLDLVPHHQWGRRRNAAHGSPATRKLGFRQDVHVRCVVKRGVSVTNGPDGQDDVMTGLVRGDGAVVLVAVRRFLIATVDGAERRAFERGTLECLVWIPAITGNEVFVLGGWVNGGVVPLEIDRAVLDFRQVPTGGGLCIHGGEQRVTTACNLAVDRSLQGRATDAGGKALEGFADTLWFVLRAATVGIQAFLTGQRTGRRYFQKAMGGSTLRGQHCR